MEAIAKARFQRISVRKARIVLDMVRGKNVALALDELRFTNKAAAPIVQKLLSSAVANYEVKYQQADLDKLFVKTAFADKAPDAHMRRWRPRAMGRATRITKGMSHLTVVVSDGADEV
ncbi:MAG: 50S ribosomal protein L22 [Myxococcales bacterium]|jgi:large subunit ribosomal protein L22|nr:50S ribosomal protein L22 [Myxococcales bacterium]